MNDDDTDLFKAYARSTDPDTSHDAAASVDPHLPNLEDTVYAAIKSRGDRGATCDEIVDLTGLNWNTVSPRLKPLRNKKLIEAQTVFEDTVIKRQGKSHRMQIVWFAKKVVGA